MAIINAAFSSRWRQSTTSVASTQTENLDVVALSSFKATKYYVQISNESQNKYKSCELFGYREGASSVVDTLYAKVGDAIDLDLNLLVSGTDVILTATNNEGFLLDVTITKLT